VGKGRATRRGVEPRQASIRVHFTWNGERCRETLELAPTVPNCKHAERMVEEIHRRIALSTFRYADFFPDSPRAKAEAKTKADTFGAYADLLIEGQYGEANLELAAATKSQYANELKRWKTRIGVDRPMRDVRHSWLKAEVSKIAFPSARMRNNSLIPLRAVFEAWVADDRARRTNPMEGIGNAGVQRGLPDPLDRGEADAIVAEMYRRYDERVAAYFEFAFYSGMRPEEQIALRWPKVDLRKRMARVDVARTFKGTEKAIKTYEARDVELNSRAMAALERMRPWTALKPHSHVFENPVTERPWHDERSQRDHYWKPALRKLGIRERRASQTRSTYATMCLMAREGMNPAWVAAQLGHDVKEFFRSYARWINAGDRGRREMAKLEAELAGPLSEEKTG
jgi:integrase